MVATPTNGLSTASLGALLSEHRDDVLDGVGRLDVAQVERMRRLISTTLDANRSVWCVGNGGSAALAGHLAAGLMRHRGGARGGRAISLADLTALLSAETNTPAPEKAFSTMLRSFAEAGDVLIALSTSGSSRNIIQAVREAERLAISTGLILGDEHSELAGRDCDVQIAVGSRVPEVAEDVFSVVIHMLYRAS